jgi:uncharacterized membrane protein
MPSPKAKPAMPESCALPLKRAIRSGRCWDTQDNSGVLLYLQLAERRLEIIADRGIAAKVPQAQWQALCDDFAAAMHRGPPDQAVIGCLGKINALLQTHFPAAHDNPKELPDQPVIL